MPSNIKCPQCAHTWDADVELEKKYKTQYEQQRREDAENLRLQQEKLEEAQRGFEEKRRRENDLFLEKVAKERDRLKTEFEAEREKYETDVRKQLADSLKTNYEQELRLAKTQADEAKQQLIQSKAKEAEFMRKEQDLEMRQKALDLEVQKNLHSERQKLVEELRNQEAEKMRLMEEENQFKMKQMQIQLDQQKKLVEEMKGKMEQGSMQLQGETQELLLEDLLRQKFPFDQIDEFRKGAEGGDCLQIVRNPLGQECGKIIFESKNTKGWGKDWIDKLKLDMRANQADVAILVTKVFPKGMERFGEKDGIWICSFAEALSVATILRNGIINLHGAYRHQENKGEKMQMLYDYLTGVEFRGHVEAIMEGFSTMRLSIVKERTQMEKLWKEREKQLDKVLMNTSGFYGSIKGIAGSSMGHISYLDGDDDSNLIDE